MDLAQLKESFASIEKQYKELRAAPIYTKDESTKDLHDRMDRIVSILWDNLDNIRSYLYAMDDKYSAQWAKHQSRHIPALTPSQMEKFLKVIGADGDYIVQKPTVSMAKTYHGLIAEVEYKK